MVLVPCLTSCPEAMRSPKLITERAEEHCLLAWPLAWDLPEVGGLLQSLSFVGRVLNPGFVESFGIH